MYLYEEILLHAVKAFRRDYHHGIITADEFNMCTEYFHACLKEVHA